MRHAAICTLGVLAGLIAAPVHGAEPGGASPPAVPAPAPALAGMPADLYETVTSDSIRPVVTTRATDVPPYIQMLLSRNVRRFADADQPYNLTDAPIGDQAGRPFERLVWAARLGDYYIVNWEYGGDVSGAAAHAFRLEPDGKARFVWSTRMFGPSVLDGQINPYRTFATFMAAVEGGKLAGSTGRCSNLMFATPAAVNLLLRRRTGAAVTDIASLPEPVQAAVRYSQGAMFKWAVPIGDFYVVDAPNNEGDAIALIHNPPRTPNKVFWKGQTTGFSRFEDFQDALRNSMSAETEAEIRAQRCTNPTGPQRAP